MVMVSVSNKCCR